MRAGREQPELFAPSRIVILVPMFRIAFRKHYQRKLLLAQWSTLVKGIPLALASARAYVVAYVNRPKEQPGTTSAATNCKNAKYTDYRDFFHGTNHSNDRKKLYQELVTTDTCPCSAPTIAARRGDRPLGVDS